jgi:hypothetical protein
MVTRFPRAAQAFFRHPDRVKRKNRSVLVVAPVDVRPVDDQFRSRTGNFVSHRKILLNAVLYKLSRETRLIYDFRPSAPSPAELLLRIASPAISHAWIFAPARESRKNTFFLHLQPASRKKIVFFFICSPQHN